MKNIEAIVNQAEEECRIRGSRLTEKRKYLLTALLRSEKALSAYELIDHCKEAFDIQIPAMSAYRILEFLEEEQFVHKLKLSNKYIACSHISCDHSHEVPQFLICKRCDSVREIAVKKSLITALKKNVENAEYQLLSSQLELDCLCPNCART